MKLVSGMIFEKESGELHFVSGNEEIGFVLARNYNNYEEITGEEIKEPSIVEELCERLGFKKVFMATKVSQLVRLPKDSKNLKLIYTAPREITNVDELLAFLIEKGIDGEVKINMGGK